MSFDINNFSIQGDRPNQEPIGSRPGNTDHHLVTMKEKDDPDYGNRLKVALVALGIIAFIAGMSTLIATGAGKELLLSLSF